MKISSKEGSVGMDRRQIDRKLKNMARRSGPIIPKEYEQKLEQLLWALPRRYPHKRTVHWKTAAAMLAVVLLLGSSGIEGAMHYLNSRMNEMTDTEVAGYNELVQGVPLNADSFSRTFSEGERERMLELQEEYLMEGRYPEGNLMIAHCESEVLEDEPFYITDSSSYYLPERELSDEELLELLDFGYKRSYSVAQSNRNTAAQATEVEASAAVERKAAEAVHAALGIDVSHMYCRVEMTESRADYYLTYEENGNAQCYVVVEAGSDRITSVVRNLTGQVESASFQQKELENGKKQLEKCLAHDIWGAITVQRITAKYYLQEDGQTVNKAEIYYLAELSDGSAYACTYNMQTQELTELYYYGTDADTIRSWQEPVESWIEDQNMNCKLVEMNNYGL